MTRIFCAQLSVLKRSCNLGKNCVQPELRVCYGPSLNDMPQQNPVFACCFVPVTLSLVATLVLFCLNEKGKVKGVRHVSLQRHGSRDVS